MTSPAVNPAARVPPHALHRLHHARPTPAIGVSARPIRPGARLRLDRETHDRKLAEYAKVVGEFDPGDSVS